MRTNGKAVISGKGARLRDARPEAGTEYEEARHGVLETFCVGVPMPAIRATAAHARRHGGRRDAEMVERDANGSAKIIATAKITKDVTRGDDQPGRECDERRLQVVPDRVNPGAGREDQDRHDEQDRVPPGSDNGARKRRVGPRTTNL